MEQIEEFKTLEEIAASMVGHIGTEGYFAVEEKDYVIMTSGVLDFVYKAKAQWLYKLLNSDLLESMLQEQILITGMIVVKIRSNKDGVNILFEDGNYNVLAEENNKEDMLPGEFDIWLEPMQNKLVALLPSEH
jgi:hypothetical protein